MEISEKETKKTINKEDDIPNNKEEPTKTLSDLFLKTKTEPYIYYLPLTEEQVQEKIKKKNKK